MLEDGEGCPLRWLAILVAGAGCAAGFCAGVSYTTLPGRICGSARRGQGVNQVSYGMQKDSVTRESRLPVLGRKDMPCICWSI